VEGFESPAAGTTTITLTGLTVTLTGAMAVRASPVGYQYGSGPSNNWIGKPLTSNPGVIGSIHASGATGFEVKSIYVWTSANAGNDHAAGPVTFTGTRAAGPPRHRDLHRHPHRRQRQ
jgi:hypothetical protein